MPRPDTPIDLSVVIDISGSMNARMSDQGLIRLDYAKQAVEMLVKQTLRPTDSISVSTFNTQGTMVQPLQQVSELDETSFLESVNKLRTSGATTLSAGMTIGKKLLDDAGPRPEATRRILFLTDMGEMRADELGNQIKSNAKEGVYVSIVGMGLEFNSSLTETVTKNKGSNYFCATNLQQLQDVMITDFDYNFFPAAFDINMHIRCGTLKVQRVFGTPFDTAERENLTARWTPETHSQYSETARLAASQLLRYSHSLGQALPYPMIGSIVDCMEPPKESITEVNTMFPSRIREDGAMQGGLILVQLEPNTTLRFAESAVQVCLEFSDLLGNSGSFSEEVSFKHSKEHFGTEDPLIVGGLRKGLLLQEYAEVCREYCDIANGPDAATAVLEAGLVEEFQARMDAWKAAAGAEMLQDVKMAQVAETFGQFSELFAGFVNDTKTDLQKI